MSDPEAIVVALPARDLEAISELVADGEVASVPDFVGGAVRVLLDDIEAGGDLADEFLETGEVSEELAKVLDEIDTVLRRRG